MLEENQPGQFPLLKSEFQGLEATLDFATRQCILLTVTGHMAGPHCTFHDMKGNMDPLRIFGTINETWYV